MGETIEKETLTDSILESIKSMLPISSDDESFDQDIIICINSAIAELRQAGVGPINGFSITDASNTWKEYLECHGEKAGLFDQVKTYIYMKTKLIFDPPSSSTVQASYEKLLLESIWRLNLTSENNL